MGAAGGVETFYFRAQSHHLQLLEQVTKLSKTLPKSTLNPLSVSLLPACIPIPTILLSTSRITFPYQKSDSGCQLLKHAPTATGFHTENVYLWSHGTCPCLPPQSPLLTLSFAHHTSATFVSSLLLQMPVFISCLHLLFLVSETLFHSVLWWCLLIYSFTVSFLLTINLK